MYGYFICTGISGPLSNPHIHNVSLTVGLQILWAGKELCSC